jgi:putative flippase GtrA
VFRSRRVAGWLIVGVCGTLLELALLRALVELLAWPLPVATAVAAEVLILGKFLMADRWVFGHLAPAVGRLVRYHGASAGAFVVYWLVINGLVELLGVAYLLGFLVGSVAAFAWSFLTNFFWVWAQAGQAKAERY